MTLRNYELRFELKPGKFIYVPTQESMIFGRKTVREILKRWTPAQYFYHFGKKGGHLAALRPHLSSKFVASVDLRRFFESTTRTKVHRALCKIGYSSKEAMKIAEQSCVSFDSKKFLPYGFSQSMALATLALEKSLVGREIEKIRALGLYITVYVDDIIISSDNLIDLEIAFGDISLSIIEANFSLSREKCSLPERQVEAFNCFLGEFYMEITPDRFDRFKQQLNGASKRKRESILRYVEVVNKDQNSVLKAIH